MAGLIVEHLYLVDECVAKWRPGNWPREVRQEMYSAGRHGLVLGAKRYDARRCAQPARFLVWPIKREIKREMKKEEKYRDRFLSQPPCGSNVQTLADSVEFTHAALCEEAALRAAALYDALEMISIHKAHPVSLKYDLGGNGCRMSDEKLGEAIGCSRKHASNRVRDGLAGLRAILGWLDRTRGSSPGMGDNRN